MPCIRQFFVAAVGLDGDALERRLYVLRRVIEARACRRGHGPAPAPHRQPEQPHRRLQGHAHRRAARPLLPRPRDPSVRSALAVVHARFSTNVLPRWDLAHPARMSAHNGEINTLRGNAAWMSARQSKFRSALFGDDIDKLRDVLDADGSDSVAVRQRARAAHHVGALHRARHDDDDPRGVARQRADRRATAAPSTSSTPRCSSRGTAPRRSPSPTAAWSGACLDRNGLRPARYLVTDDGLVVMASEAGVLDIPEERIVKKWRLDPGRLLLVDTEAGAILDDDAIKEQLAGRHPYGDWIRSGTVRLDELPPGVDTQEPDSGTLRIRQHLFGWTDEDLRLLVAPDGRERRGAGGIDGQRRAAGGAQRPPAAAVRVLQAAVRPGHQPAHRPDPRGVGDVAGHLARRRRQPPRAGPGAGGAAGDAAPHPHQRRPGHHPPRHPAAVPSRDDHRRLPSRPRRRRPARRARAHLPAGVRGGRGGPHHPHPQRPGRRRRPRAHPLAAGHGCGAPPPPARAHPHRRRPGGGDRRAPRGGPPRPAHRLRRRGGQPLPAARHRRRDGGSGAVAGVDAATAQRNVVQALRKGLLKTIAKMGISTVLSYCGAQLFEAVGPAARTWSTRYFTGTPTRIGGAGLDRIAARRAQPPRARLPGHGAPPALLDPGGRYQWRRDGEKRAWNPEVIGALQHAVRSGLAEEFDRYVALADRESAERRTLRGLLGLREAETAVPLDEVESADTLVHRFATGAMSLGSISPEMHETLAIAMNRIGGRSNTGEGGEDAARFATDGADSTPQRHQAGGVGALRGHRQLPRQRRRDPDQGRPGRQARRGRPAARRQGGRHHRAAAPRHPGRRAHLSPTAPRRLLGRGPRPADPRPPLGQPARADQRQAGRRDGRGPDRRGGGQGARRPHRRLRVRGRHRGRAPVVAHPRGRPVGARSRRGAADARRQRAARPRGAAERRADAHRARRRRRRAARRRGVRLRHRAAGRCGLRDDARLPPQHLPGRHRHPGPAAARALHRARRAHRHLHALPRRGRAQLDVTPGCRVDSTTWSAASSCCTRWSHAATSTSAGCSSRPESHATRCRAPPHVCSNDVDERVIALAGDALEQRHPAAAAHARRQR